MTQIDIDARYMLAVASGSLDEVRSCVGAGANINALSPQGYSALYSAVIYNKRPEVFRHLLDIGVQGFKREGNGSLIATIVCNDMIEHLDIMLEYGASPNSREPDTGTTLLMMAAGSSNGPAMLQHLLQRGADPSVTDDKGATALHRASTPEIAKILIDAGIPVDAADNTGVTPLASALATGRWDMFYNDEREVAKTLISHGANVNATVSSDPLLHKYAAKGDAEAVSILLEGGASPNLLDHRGRTALLVHLDPTTGRSGDKDWAGVLGALLEHGADLEVECNGERALHIAVRKGDIHSFTTLLAAGADTNARTGKGYTLDMCLSFVVIEKQDQMRSILASHHARSVIRNAMCRRVTPNTP